MAGVACHRQMRLAAAALHARADNASRLRATCTPPPCAAQVLAELAVASDPDHFHNYLGWYVRPYDEGRYRQLLADSGWADALAAGKPAEE